MSNKTTRKACRRLMTASYLLFIIEIYKNSGINSSQNFHKIISTHLLTVLIIRVILQLEQGRRKEIINSDPG